MVESVDTRDLKSLGVRAVRVQVPLRVPWEIKNKINDKQCRETAPKGGFFMPVFRFRQTFAIRFRHIKRALLPYKPPGLLIACGCISPLLIRSYVLKFPTLIPRFSRSGNRVCASAGASKLHRTCVPAIFCSAKTSLGLNKMLSH